MNTCVYAVFVYPAQTTLSCECTVITHNTFRHYYARFYSLVGQLFSKQVYVVT